MIFEYKTLDLSRTGLFKLSELLKTVFPEDEEGFSVEYLKWLYCDNPDGKAVGYNAYRGQKLVGHYICQPVRAMIDGNDELGLLSINTAVHPSCRGKGLFKQLALKTYEKAIKNKYKFVMGISNTKSTPLFVDVFDFQWVSPLSVKIGVGKIKYKNTIKTRYSFYRLWNQASLRWRCNRPDKQYYTSKNKNDQRIFAPTGRFHIDGQLIVLDKKNELDYLPKRTNLNPLKLWIGLDPNYDSKQSFYINIPKKLKPSPLNLIFKDLTDQKRLLKKDKVKINLIDFDAY